MLTHLSCRGSTGDEVNDESFNLVNARRRSNSSNLSSLDNFKTKFEFNEPEPVFEETMHGAESDHEDELVKTETSSSA